MAWVCANEQGFGSATKRKSSIPNNSRPWHCFRCSAQSPRTQCGTGRQFSFNGSHKLASSVPTPTHLHCSSHHELHPYGFSPEAVMWGRAPEAKAILASEARGGHRHSRTLWPVAWAHSQPSLPSTIGAPPWPNGSSTSPWELSLVQKCAFAFPKWKALEWP